MVSAAVRSPFSRDFAVRLLRVSFVNKDIATATVLDNCFGWRGVARYHDLPVGGFETIAKRALHFAMTHWKCRNGDIAIFVDDAGPDLVRIDTTPIRFESLWAMYPIGDVQFPRFGDVLGHRLEPRRAIDIEWLAPAHDPRGKDQVGITCRMIRMQMRQKDLVQLGRPEAECRHAVVISSRYSSNDARTEVDKIRSFIDDDGSGRARPIRVRARSSGPEHDNFRCRIGFPLF